jgi:uncharacterized protein YodC (DUF2158 family)
VSENNFTIGELVKLKSGGPKMTVTEITESGKVRCAFFTRSGYGCELFLPDTIEPWVDEDD